MSVRWLECSAGSECWSTEHTVGTGELFKDLVGRGVYICCCAELRIAQGTGMEEWRHSYATPY